MRIVVLTYESHQANVMTQHLLRQFPGQIVGIVSSAVIVSGKNHWQSFWFLLRKAGLSFVVRKGVEILLGRAAPCFLQLAGKRPRIRSLKQMARQFSVPLVSSKNVNSRECISVLRGWQPDLIVSVYLNQLIRPKLIKLPSKGVINVHGALLPKNRGLFPYFWALANGDGQSGVTVHWVDSKFDNGAILLQRPLPISHQETVVSLARKTAELGAELLVEAVELIAAGNPLRQRQEPVGASYFSWPTPEDFRRFKRQGRRYGSIFELWKDLVS